MRPHSGTRQGIVEERLCAGTMVPAGPRTPTVPSGRRKRSTPEKSMAKRRDMTCTMRRLYIPSRRRQRGSGANCGARTGNLAP